MRERKGGISADWLKVTAMAAMVVDHAGAVLFPQILELRLIGRIAFPVYIWLLVEGFVHTSSRKRYFLQMAALAVISELPFDLAFSGGWDLGWQNVYFTLLTGLLLLTVLEKTAKGGIVCALLATVALMAVSEFGGFDYGCTGPVLVAVFYSFEKRQKPNRAAGFALFACSNLLRPVFSGLFSGALWNGLLAEPLVWEGAFGTVVIESFGILAVPLLARYNGIRRWKRGKLLFYFFYPVHLLVIYGIHLLVTIQP